jgi:hypothetical protein
MVGLAWWERILSDAREYDLRVDRTQATPFNKDDIAEYKEGASDQWRGFVEVNVPRQSP